MKTSFNSWIEAETPPQNISANTRLLVVVTPFYSNPYIEMGRCKDGKLVSDGGDLRCGKITHWMRLPVMPGR